ncbi:unnamed protein product, partial [Discosporangium mesarthrocarpum]
FFIVYKGAKGLDLDETPLETAFAWALGLGFGLGLIMLPAEPVAKELDEEVKTGGGLVGFVKGQLDSDIHASIKEDANVSAIHDRAEKFDPRTEEVFKYVQVFTAICDSFSHGANDVANAMGPF